MTAKSLKQLALLGVLVTVFAVIVHRNLTSDPAAPAPAPSNPKVTTAPARSRQTPVATVTDVKLDLLSRESGASGTSARDPFRFKPKPAPVVKAPPQVVKPIVTPAPPPAPRPPQGDPPERLIRYSGYIVSASGKPTAILSYGIANSSTVVQVIGVEGDIIEGRYRLQRIEKDAIEVAELSGDGRRARITRQ
jgi:hypothetical protein